MTFNRKMAKHIDVKIRKIDHQIQALNQMRIEEKMKQEQDFRKDTQWEDFWSF